MLESDLDLVYVGNSTDIVMYEGAANEITEANFNAALKFAQARLSPPTLGQWAGAVLDQVPASYTQAVVAEYRKRRDLVLEGLACIART